MECREAQSYVWKGAIPLHESELTTLPGPPPALELGLIRESCSLRRSTRNVVVLFLNARIIASASSTVKSIFLSETKMSIMEEGPLPLGALLAEEKLRWTSLASTEADCVAEKDSIPKYLYLSHERNKISRFKFNNRVSGHQISNGRSMDFGEDGYFMHKPGSGWVKDEMLKCRQTSFSGGDTTFNLEECGGDFVNDGFEEENFDCLCKSGSLSNELLIHQKKNMSFKGTTWICSQDQASFTSRRRFYDRLR